MVGEHGAGEVAVAVPLYLQAPVVVAGALRVGVKGAAALGV